MFNAETKLRYKQIREQEVILPPNALVLDFGRTEPYETKLNKDIYDFTVYEIINMYKTWSIKSIGSVYNINSRLKQYTIWALSQNLVKDNQNHFAEIDREMICQCVNQIVLSMQSITRSQVLVWCSALSNVSDKFMLLGLYEGLGAVETADLWDVAITDIDKEKKTIRVKRGEIPISDDLIEFAEESNNTLTFFSDTSEKETQLIETGKILKQSARAHFDDPRHKDLYVRNRFRKIFQFLGIYQWVRPLVLNETAYVHYIKERATELGITSHDYLWNGEYLKEVEYRYNRTITRSNCWKRWKSFFEN